MLIAIATLMFGVWATLAPRKLLLLVGLAAQDGRGITEARVAFGAIYIGTGLTCLWFREQAVFAALGFAYLVMAGVRLVAIVRDQSSDRSNWASLALETVMGLLLLI